MLKEWRLSFNLAFTSVLTRAVKTLFYIQDAMSLHWVPVVRDWRLNERHYGILQGQSKSEMVAKYGEQQVKVESGASIHMGQGGHVPPNIWTGGDIITNVPLNISNISYFLFYLLLMVTSSTCPHQAP